MEHKQLINILQNFVHHIFFVFVQFQFVHHRLNKYFVIPQKHFVNREIVSTLVFKLLFVTMNRQCLDVDTVRSCFSREMVWSESCSGYPIYTSRYYTFNFWSFLIFYNIIWIEDKSYWLFLPNTESFTFRDISYKHQNIELFF